jgi:hypothetical protein
MRMYRSSDFSSLYSDLARILQLNSERLCTGGAGSSIDPVTKSLLIYAAYEGGNRGVRAAPVSATMGGTTNLPGEFQ